MREVELYVPAESLETLGFGAFFAELREANVNDITTISCDDPGAVVAISAEEKLDDALDEFDIVEWWEQLVEESNGVTYLCKIVATDFPGDTSPSHERGVDKQDASLDDHGVSLSMVGSQEALSREVADIQSAGANVVLRRLGDYSGPNSMLDSLTDRQREVLETARDVGYYEVPRRTTIDAIADRLDIDSSTASEHLQRAERHLVDAALPN
jgi:DNA-binding CsgD family transcriptional regulator